MARRSPDLRRAISLGLYVRFSAQKELLPKTQLVLDKDGQTLTLDLKTFIKEK